jgi:hypothetical protein
MIPVFQTMTIDKDGTGNCMNACVASILELTLKETCQVLPTDKGWHTRWDMWLKNKGYKLEVRLLSHPPKGYGILSITTDRVYPEGHSKAGEPIYHAVVTYGEKIIHDPFPTGSTVTSKRHYQELVPMTESEIRYHQIRSENGFCRHGYFDDCESCEEKIKI